MLDKKPDEPRETIELKASKDLKQQAPPAEPSQDRGAVDTAAAQAGERAEPAVAAGAAAGAGVLTAVDEDEEGGEEAPVPDEFGYETQGEDDVE